MFAAAAEWQAECQGIQARLSLDASFAVSVTPPVEPCSKNPVFIVNKLLFFEARTPKFRFTASGAYRSRLVRCTLTLRGIPIDVWSEVTTLHEVSANWWAIQSPWWPWRQGHLSHVAHPQSRCFNWQDSRAARNRLCQLIRQDQLDANLVKAYATDFCGVKTLREATREQVENFVGHLADWAEKDRNALT